MGIRKGWWIIPLRMEVRGGMYEVRVRKGKT